METIVKNSMAHVAYDRSRKLLIYEWHGLVNVELGLETFRVTMDFIQRNQCHFVLHDASQITGTFTKLNRFMSTEVAPNFEKHGGIRSAVVMSKDVFSLFAINQFLRVTKIGKAETKLFSSRYQATRWLEELMNN